MTCSLIMQLITVNERFRNSLNSCLQLTLSVQWAALARFALEADLWEGKGEQVWSLQPTCLSAGPQGAVRAVPLLLLPIAAASHCCLPQSNQLSSPANYGG